MKKHFLITSGIILVCMIILSSCNSTAPADPCNNTGTLCIENKMDSTVIVSIVQKKQQVTLQKDFMECFDLEANLPYTVSVSGAGYTKPDTTLMILPCDNKLIVVKQ